MLAMLCHCGWYVGRSVDALHIAQFISLLLIAGAHVVLVHPLVLLSVVVGVLCFIFYLTLYHSLINYAGK